MFSLSYGKRLIVEESQKISASSCVRNYLINRPISIIQPVLDLNKEEDIEKLISEIEEGTTYNLTKENFGKIEYPEPQHVRLTYSKSNLGKGFVFWFICNVCGRRTRYLYFPPNSTILACRKCHRLAYDIQNEGKRFRQYRRLLRV